MTPKWYIIKKESAGTESSADSFETLQFSYFTFL